MSNKRLYKSSVNCMVCGVCGGIAEYFDIDPTLVRLAWVILTCFGGAGFWAYIIARSLFQEDSLLFSSLLTVIIFSVSCIVFLILLILLMKTDKECENIEQG